jgi:hypothetical protein
VATPAFVPPFVLIEDTGETTIYEDLASLDAACLAAGIIIGDGHKVHSDFRSRLIGDPLYRHNKWIVRDLFGRIVTLADIRAHRKPHRYRWDSRRDLQALAAAKGLPIPWCGGWKRGRNYYRRPQHMAVYREAEIARIVEREEGWKVRGKIHRPPNAWDDLMASDWGHRTWKRSRKTKWRKSAVSFRMMVREEQ